MTTILIPLPLQDFDPSEVAIPWKLMKDAGIKVVFSTPDGTKPQCDPMMISGEGLDPWAWIPFLRKVRFIGLMLRASSTARQAYALLENDQEFCTPLSYAALNVDDYDGLWLPGGHAPQMRPYLEDSVLQNFVVDFFEQQDKAEQAKPIAAICHGVVLAARSISPRTQKSILYGRKTTALTWKLEQSAWHLTKYFARFWDSNYYRTYQESRSDPAAYWSVEQEVKRALEHGQDFKDVPKDSAHHFLKTAGLFRDSAGNHDPAWVVEDGHYLSARWPGDAHTLAQQFVDKLTQNMAS